MRLDPVEQSENKHQLLTPDEAAEELRVTAEQVRCLIRGGKLAAINVGSGQKRPLYRITTQALEEFCSRRHHPGRIVQKRAFKPRPPVQDLFPDLK